MDQADIKFSGADQLRFAELSGDFNPMHLDSVYARRTLFGEIVVHGMHVLLRVLDLVLADRKERTAIRSLEARFLAPVFPDRTVSVRKIDNGPDNIRLQVSKGQRLLSDITILFERGKTRRLVTDFDVEVFPMSDPTVREAGNSISVDGSETLRIDPSVCQSIFPVAAEILPLGQLAALLSTTRIVGMKCPGLHSVFSELHLRFGEADPGDKELRYSVSQYDERFRRLTIAVSGAGTDGEIQAFERPPPQLQADIDDLTDYVDADEFAGHRALVVGGSRGLGEIAGKLLSAGGADTKLTYVRGATESQSLVEELRLRGFTADALELDVRGDIEAFVRDLGDWHPTMLLYFATPGIFRQRYEPFSSALFDEFAEIYVSAMAKLFYELHARCEIEILIYPSSVAVEDTPRELVEYAAAKAAGENLCRSLSARFAQLDVRTPRFPRVPTDQTASLFRSATEDPVSLMLSVLRPDETSTVQNSDVAR